MRVPHSIAIGAMMRFGSRSVASGLPLREESYLGWTSTESGIDCL